MHDQPLTWTVTMPSMARIDAAAEAIWNTINSETLPLCLSWQGMIDVGGCDAVMDRMRRRAYAALVAVEGVA